VRGRAVPHSDADPPVTIAGHRVEPLNVQNGDATSANLNKARILEGALDQIDGGSLHSEHLPEEFLCQPDVVASQPLSALDSHLAARLST